MELASFQIGARFDRKKAEEAFGKQIEITADRWLIKDFIPFQYGNLEASNKMFRGVSSRLLAFKEGASIPHTSPSNGGMVMDMVKDDSKEGGVGETKPTAEILLNLWNTEAHPNLPRIRFLTETRKRQALARLSANPEPSFWKEVIERVNRSPLLKGETGSWKATFDWILNPSNLAKIMEGNYEPNKRS